MAITMTVDNFTRSLPGQASQVQGWSKIIRVRMLERKLRSSFVLCNGRLRHKFLATLNETVKMEGAKVHSYTNRSKKLQVWSVINERLLMIRVKILHTSTICKHVDFGPNRMLELDKYPFISLAFLGLNQFYANLTLSPH